MVFVKVDPADAISALPVPSAPKGGRGSELTVPTSHALGAELQVIKDALDHQPKSVSLSATIASVASSLLLIGKILKDAWSNDHFSLGQLNLFLFSAAVIAGAASVYAYVDNCYKKQPLQDRAKEYVQRLMDAQKAER